MNAKELFQDGKLDEAVQALSRELRENPSDVRRRTFLFELLCFAGEYDRADKQLDVLAQGGPNVEMGTLLYRAALHAERSRQELFRKKDYPTSDFPSARQAGSINGVPFEALTDADPRVGARLEVFAAGSYLWIPMEHVTSVEVEAPKRLRDLLWVPAKVRTGPAFKGTDLGEVFVPALAPFSWRNPDNAVRLGRETVWVEDEGEAVPVGQKLLLVDGEEFPLLELRKLEFTPPPAAS